MTAAVTAARPKSVFRGLWERDKKLYAVCAVLCLVQLALRAVMKSRPASNFAVRYLVRPYHKAVGYLCGFLPFSLAECCWAVLILFCVWYAVRTVWFLIRPPRRYAEQTENRPEPSPFGTGAVLRLSILWRRTVGALALAAAVYTGFTLLWGLVYYTDSFEEQASLSVTPVTVEELEATTRLFVDKLNETAPLVSHIEPGALTGNTAAIFAASDTLYDALTDTYPFLDKNVVQPKQLSPLFSRIMSVINYTGFFFPFTGEANLNVDAPECLLPATIAHELAHVRGVAPEQTANFLAILACDMCGDPIYAYSGYLMGYIHLSNALYGASYDKWYETAVCLCSEANNDLSANNAYWQQFESPVSETVESTYSTFLQSYDQPLGSKSYGAVVDLLVAYYGRK